MKTYKSPPVPHLPSDTFFTFIGQEFLYLDYNKDEWAWGSVASAAGSDPLSIPENASVVRPHAKHNCEHSHAFILGGVTPQGALLNWAFGLEFQ